MNRLKSLGIEINDNNIYEGAIYSVASAYSLLEKSISDYLRPYKLTPAKFNAMMIIKHIGKEKGMMQIEVGRRLIVSASNMTRLLDKLERDGLIERFSQEGDRRVNLTKISKKGSGLLDKIWPGYYAKVQELASFLGESELHEIIKLLDKWCIKLGR